MTISKERYYRFANGFTNNFPAFVREYSMLSGQELSVSYLFQGFKDFLISDLYR